MKARYPFLFWAALLAPAAVGAQTPYLHAPAVDQYATHNPAGLTILPTGRFLKPVGKATPVGQWPHSLAISPDGSAVFIASGNVGQFLTGWDGPSPVVTDLTPTGPNNRTRNAIFSPSGKTLYWCGGETGSVYFFDVATKQQVADVPLNVETDGQKYADSYIMDIAASPDGNYLYCADVANFRVAVIDVAQRQVVGSVRVGRYPYALAVVGKQVYVANIGLFAYSPVPAPDSEAYDRRGLTFPPFGYPSKEAEEGVEFEGRRISGLGRPNVPESFSVWGLDVSNPAHPKVISRVKTGLLVGAPSDKGKTVGGSAPNFLAVYGSALYVSDGNNDMVEKVTPGVLQEPNALRTPPSIFAWKTRIRPSLLTAKLRGVGPSGIALSKDGTRLYVAESGINAIGVLDTRTGKVLGHIPTGWYPYRVALSPDGRKLLCICFRGFGNGPKTLARDRGSKASENPTPDAQHPTASPYLGMKGAFLVLDVPADRDLPQMTANVLAYNGMVDKSADRAAMASPVIPTTPGKASGQIKYLVFITKENHTYDTIFDHIPGANDDPSLLRWGYHQTISAPGQPTLENVAVMTNHNALARQFAVSDNFYMEPEASGVGHRWLIGVQPNNFCQMTYTLGWDFKANSTAPGRRTSFDSAGSIAPEDYPEAGAMWEHLTRNGIPFRNYGEGFEFAGVGEDEDEHRTGAREVINMPMPKDLYDNTCRDFPIFNMNIPDQYRAYWFEQDFTKQFLGNGKNPTPYTLHPTPFFINIAICNDHGDDPKPAKGYPYIASWMADNDLALGRIVEFLTHTPYWKNMAIFVTQDDSGGEPDHVDAQRSVMLVISPWVKRGYVSHRLTTIVSMHRTMYEIFGLPPLNMFDALANDFSDFFTAKPDFRPYTHVPVDSRIFDPEKAKDPKDPDYRSARLEPSIRRDDEKVEERVLRGGH
jgi:YVTN family beta-propeller protein